MAFKVVENVYEHGGSGFGKIDKFNQIVSLEVYRFDGHDHEVNFTRCKMDNQIWLIPLKYSGPGFGKRNKLMLYFVFSGIHVYKA